MDVVATTKRRLRIMVCTLLNGCVGGAGCVKHAVRISQTSLLQNMAASACHVMHQNTHASHMIVHVHLQHDLL
jgi:hypothetical protein